MLIHVRVSSFVWSTDTLTTWVRESQISGQDKLTEIHRIQPELIIIPDWILGPDCFQRAADMKISIKPAMYFHEMPSLNLYSKVQLHTLKKSSTT